MLNAKNIQWVGLAGHKRLGAASVPPRRSSQDRNEVALGISILSLRNGIDAGIHPAGL